MEFGIAELIKIREGPILLHFFPNIKKNQKSQKIEYLKTSPLSCNILSNYIFLYLFIIQVQNVSDELWFKAEFEINPELRNQFEYFTDPFRCVNTLELDKIFVYFSFIRL